MRWSAPLSRSIAPVSASRIIACVACVSIGPMIGKGAAGTGAALPCGAAGLDFAIAGDGSGSARSAARASAAAPAIEGNQRSRIVLAPPAGFATRPRSIADYARSRIAAIDDLPEQPRRRRLARHRPEPHPIEVGAVGSDPHNLDATQSGDPCAHPLRILWHGK